MADILSQTIDIFDVDKIQPLIEKSDLSKKLKQDFVNELNSFLSACRWDKKYKNIQKQILKSRDR